jgi:opacity protein-like surface antigen
MTVLRVIRYVSVLSMALIAINPPVFADGISGLYIGASVGLAKIATDNAAYQAELENEAAGLGTLEFTSAELHDRKAAIWANVGYMVWPYVGIDLSYLHFGELYNQVNGSFTSSFDGSSNFVGAATRLSSKGPALGLLFRVPILENFDVNLRFADYYARTKLTNILNSLGYTTAVQSANRSSLMVGMGASYLLTGHWSARLDYLRVQHAGDSTIASYNIGMIAVGATYTF